MAILTIEYCIFSQIEDSSETLLSKHGVDIVKNLQRIRGLDGDYDNDSGSSSGNVGRRKTIHNLENNMKRKRTIGTLDVAFKERFFKMKEENGTSRLLQSVSSLWKMEMYQLSSF